MIVTAMLIAAAILVSNVMQFSNYVDEGVELLLDRALDKMQVEIDELKNEAYLASLYFAGDAELASALTNSNRDALVGRIATLQSRTDVDLCIITNSQGTVVARSTNTNAYGDNLSEMLCVATALTGRFFVSLEQGIAGGISADAGAPIVDNLGRLLGVVVVGIRLDTEGFVDSLKVASGCDHTLFVNQTRVVTTIHDQSGAHVPDTDMLGSIIKMIEAGNDGSDHLMISDREMSAKYILLEDADGQMLGVLLAEHFLADKTDVVLSFIMRGALVAVIVLGIAVIIILLMIGRVSSPIEGMIGKAYHDSLTGVYNRRYFDDNIDRLIMNLSRSNGSLSLMVIDVDFFKNYNDTYGHNKGDVCLKKIAETLKSSVMRVSDFVVRYGGEEFIVALPNADESGARTTAVRLLENVRNLNIPHEMSDAGKTVTISIGVTAGAVMHTQVGSDYVKRADELLYESKHNGRDRYTFGQL